MGWLLREVELALLNVHRDTLKIDLDTGSATLRISSSKTDPSGRGASRTWPCRCNLARRPSCPACSAKVLLELAMENWQGDRDSEEAKGIPLIGTVGRPTAVVSKRSMVEAAQSDAGHLYIMNLLPVDPSAVTGHFLRRSGAKALARLGVPLAKIQWLGRWGSAAVMAYVEEATEEAPVELDCASWDQVREDLAKVLRCAGPTSLEAEPRELRREMIASGVLGERLDAVESFLSSVQGELGRTSQLCIELDGLVRPEFVLNLAPQRGRGIARTVHKAVRVERLDPDLCTTSCGWKWGRSGHARPVLAAELEQAGDMWHKCPRCFPAEAQAGGAF